MQKIQYFFSRKKPMQDILFTYYLHIHDSSVIKVNCNRVPNIDFVLKKH